MSRKSLKILLVLVTILSLISTFSLATDDTAVPTSEDATVLSTQNPETTEGTEGETTDTTTEGDATDSTTEESLENTNPVDVENDLYLCDTDVTISQTVYGNVFVMADTLTITGQIAGDVFAIASTINIDGGQISGNVFALSENFILNGVIYDLYAVCDNLTVYYDGIAYRDLKVICDTATINGFVGKNVNITAGSSLTLEDKFLAYGDFNYSAPNEIEIAEGMVTGTINYEELGSNISTANVMDYILDGITTLIFTLIIWLLLSKFAPNFYGKVTGLPVKNMLIAVLIGLIALLVVPFVSIILLFTVVGAPIAFTILAVYGVLLAISSAIATIAIANLLANKVKVLSKLNNLLSVILVALVLWALSYIPYVGAVISFLVLVLGLGMILMSIYNKKEKVVETKTEE